MVIITLLVRRSKQPKCILIGCSITYIAWFCLLILVLVVQTNIKSEMSFHYKLIQTTTKIDIKFMIIAMSKFMILPEMSFMYIFVIVCIP